MEKKLKNIQKIKPVVMIGENEEIKKSEIKKK